MEWMPIEKIGSAGLGDREMFVVKGIDVLINPWKSTNKYTTDAYCVWRGSDGEFIRWPHPFPPTHFAKLPADPKD